jgi:hypothetical protein
VGDGIVMVIVTTAMMMVMMMMVMMMIGVDRYGSSSSDIFIYIYPGFSGL